jgi:GNAT superfamily N-acetyltransferase
MPVETRVVTTRRDLKRFVNFPFRLYADCPQWVPQIVSDELRTLSADRNPAFDYCRARYWLAYREGRVVGRIAAIINERYIEKWQNKYARFGWVDFADDQEVSAALFGAVEEWAAAEGMTGVHGPMGFTDLDAEGLLIEGFEEMGTLTDPYTYHYYPDHLESLGYRKDIDWVEYEVLTPDAIPEKALRVGSLILKRYGLRLVPARKSKQLLPYAHQVFDLINEAYAHLYGTVELTTRQVDAYINQYFGFIDPRFNKVIVDADDRVVAFGLILPSLSQALRKAHGRLLPFGFIHLLRAFRRPRTLNMALIAVRPDFQGRGIPALLFAEVTQAAIENGVVSAETGRELEDNVQVRSLWKSYTARQHKRRRVYLKELA